MTRSHDRSSRRRAREERVVHALHSQGILQRSPTRRAAFGTLWRRAAGLLALAGAGGIGYFAGLRQAPGEGSSGAGLVQERGQAYVQSIAELSEVLSADSLSYEQARDAAMSAMLAAAYALSRARPSDSVATRLTSEIHRVRSSAAQSWVSR